MLVKSLTTWVYVLSVCSFAAAVTAAPTIGNTELDSLINFDQEQAMPLSAPVITVSSEYELASIGKKILQPPAVMSEIKTTIRPVRKSLPNAPAAVLLGVIGFLCVTGIKDRKEWLTALATIIWLSQAGITAIPKLVPHFQAKKHIKHSSCLEKGYARLFEKSSRLRSEVEGSKYIAMLHQLSSIPDDHSSAISYIDISQPAIVYKRNTLNLHLHCSAVRTEQFTCFSPAFIFCNLSRGPPAAA